MTSPQGNRNTAAAWFSVLDGAVPTFNDRLVDLWRLTPEERAQLACATGGAAVAALVEFVARRAADPEPVRGLLPPGRLLHDTIVQTEVLLADGRTVEIFGAPVRAAAGNVVGRMVFYRDVTQRRRDEADLRDQARRQSALARLARIAIAAEAIEPLLESAVAIVAETLGVELCAVMEVVGPSRLVLRAGVGWPVAALGASIEVGSRLEVALSLMAAGPLAAVDTGGGAAVAGEPLPFEATTGAAVLIQGRDGPYGVLAGYGAGVRPFGREDLSFLETAAGVLGSALARHQAEADTRERDATIRALFARSRDAILVVDPRGEIRDANPAACAALEQEEAELVGRSLPAALHAGSAHDPGAAWQRFLAAGRQQSEVEVPQPEGPPKSFEYSALADVVPGRHLVILRDVTERRQLTARLALADRMASVGTMAAGVAHELNNPLAYVSANLSYVGEGLRSILAAAPDAAALRDADGMTIGAELARAIDEARQGAERMRVIIRDLLAMSRSDEATRGPVEVAGVIESCINIARNEIRSRATLEKALAVVPPVLGNPARLSQVFLNLLVNAAQAIPLDGAGTHRIRIATSRAEDGRVVVEISDTGDGIRPEHLPRIFDPFFTTKPIGIGTGLGLAICHSIVTSYGGEIRVQSAVGRGTTFQVLLAPAMAAGGANGSARGTDA